MLSSAFSKFTEKKHRFNYVETGLVFCSLRPLYPFGGFFHPSFLKTTIKIRIETGNR